MLKQRILTALALVGVLLPILFLAPGEVAIATFAVIAVLAGWEWSRLLGFASTARILFPLWILAACLISYLYPELRRWLCLLAAVAWLFVPFWLVGRWPLGRGIVGWLTGTLVLVPAWAGMVYLYEIGPAILLAAMAMIWVADIAAYFTGRAFGRHKLALAISPGKTWEGAGGAVVGAILYVLVLRQLGVIPPGNAVLLALGVAVLVAVSIVGDLFESMIKRQAGVKDSSQLLPGHGGILDRIDSLTSTLPVLAAASSAIGFLSV